MSCRHKYSTDARKTSQGVTFEELPATIKGTYERKGEDAPDVFAVNKDSLLVKALHGKRLSQVDAQSAMTITKSDVARIIEAESVTWFAKRTRTASGYACTYTREDDHDVDLLRCAHSNSGTLKKVYSDVICPNSAISPGTSNSLFPQFFLC